MSITAIVLVLILLVIGVVAFGVRREEAQTPAGMQTLVVLLFIIIAVVGLVYAVMRRAG